MSRESSLWAWLSKDAHDGLHMTRVENLIDEGTPDVEGCLKGPQFWCELKVADRPKRPTTRIRTKSPVGESQIEWLHARWLAGGLAWMLVQVGERHEARRYLLPGIYASSVQEGLTESEMSRRSMSAPDGRDRALAILVRMTWR